MASILKLQVNGVSYERPNATKITDISQEEYDELLPLMTAIIGTKAKTQWNFNRYTELVWDYTKNDWVRDYSIKKQYPATFHKEIDKLMKYVPENMDGIDSFVLMKVETLNKVV